MSRKILGLIVTMCMLVACIPAYAFASGGDEDDSLDRLPVTKLYIEGVDALENPSGDGWVFDQDTGILTLENCNLSEAHDYETTYGDTVNTIIYVEGDLTIELIGDNHVERTIENGTISCLTTTIHHWQGNYSLKIQGSGSLIAGVAIAPDVNVSEWTFGIANDGIDLNSLEAGGKVDVYCGVIGAEEPNYNYISAYQNAPNPDEPEYPAEAAVLSYDDIEGKKYQGWFNWNNNKAHRVIITMNKVMVPEIYDMDGIPTIPETSEFYADSVAGVQANMLNRLEADLNIVDYPWIGTQYFDIASSIWNNGGWESATENDFAALGALPVSIPISSLAGASASDHFYVLHVFEKGQMSGSYETPAASVSNGNLVFELNGCSPVLIAWTDEDLVPTHTHTPVLQEKVDATCHSTGMKKHWKCECGKLFTDEACDNEVAEADLVIAEDPANHDGETEIRDVKEATATEAGYTGDTYCKGCGEKIADGEVIPPTGSGGIGDILDDNDNNDSDKNSNDNDKKDSDASAKTGDESNTALWMALLLISLIGGCAAVIRRKEC